MIPHIRKVKNARKQNIPVDCMTWVGNYKKCHPGFACVHQPVEFAWSDTMTIVMFCENSQTRGSLYHPLHIDLSSHHWQKLMFLRIVGFSENVCPFVPNKLTIGRNVSIINNFRRPLMEMKPNSTIEPFSSALDKFSTNKHTHANTSKR